MANRLYAQYKGKPKITAWSDIPKNFVSNITDVAKSVRDSYDIDNNSGEALDVVGRIVGRDRGFIQSITFDVYEMNTDGDFEFGDDSIQMSPISVAADAELSDRYYRYLLKSKIAKNNTDATIDDILTVVNEAVVGLEALRLVDGEDMSFSIEFYGDIDAIALDLLRSGEIVPRPQGVKFNGFLQGVNMTEMNADGDFEFGDESTEMVGFIGV